MSKNTMQPKQPRAKAGVSTTAPSRVLPFDPQAFRWQGADVEVYKEEPCGWNDIRRVPLTGMHGEKTKFHVRYFEMDPGGQSSREYHKHEHVVIVFRGTGEIFMDDTWHPVKVGDVVYVSPNCVHQARATGEEPFGIFCMVDAKRDTPTVVDCDDAPDAKSSCELR